MKRTKMTLTLLAVLLVVGSAFAFKGVTKQVEFCGISEDDPANTPCYIFEKTPVGGNKRHFTTPTYTAENCHQLTCTTPILLIDQP